MSIPPKSQCQWQPQLHCSCLVTALNYCTVVAARFAHLFLDSPTLIAMYYLPYENEELKKLCSFQDIVAPSIEIFMKKALHWGYSFLTQASDLCYRFIPNAPSFGQIA